MGIIYKIDVNSKQRLSVNIDGYFTELPFLKISKGTHDFINVTKGDFIFYSDDDLPINSVYKVVIKHSGSFCEVEKI